MPRPRLVSKNTIYKYKAKKIQKKQLKQSKHLSNNFTVFLLLFLGGGLAVTYYKYLMKQIMLDKSKNKI